MDESGPDTHPAQISDRVALFVQSERTELHDLALKNRAVLRQQLDLRVSSTHRILHRVM